MCLGIPMKVIECHSSSAICELDGVQREIALQLIDSKSVRCGDYLIVHLGFAIERIDSSAAKTAQTTWQEWQMFVEQKR